MALSAIFVMLRLSGDPASVMLPFDASEEERQNLRISMGLDRPLYVQYASFLTRIGKGDFGDSVRYRQRVTRLIGERLAATLTLAFVGLGIAVIAGVPLGVLQGVRQGSILDWLTRTIAVGSFAIPGFWLGMMLIMLFSVQLGWLPSSGYGSWRHLILPAITLSVSFFAYVTLLVRDGIIETLRQDYVRTARAKGLRTRSVLFKHALRNALIPVVGFIGTQAGPLLGGAVITESVFQWPGLGLLAVQSIGFRDFPVVQGAVFFLVVGVVFMNLVADVSYTIVDPRIRYT